MSDPTALAPSPDQVFRQVLGHFPTGVAVVTAVDDDGPVGFTCQSFVALSLEPPLVALAPARTSVSWPRIARAGTFCVNVLEQSQAHVCKQFARSGGDKFTGIRWETSSRGSPRLVGCLAWVECELVTAYDAGDHELVVGRVIDLGHGEGGPLVYYRGGFGGFTPAL